MSINKQAFYRYAGREIGLREMTQRAAASIEKTASEGGDVSDESRARIADFSGSLAYNNELQKIAHRRGRVSGFKQAAEALRQGEDPEKVASQLEEAIEKSAGLVGVPSPDSQAELESFQDQMVAGAVEAISTVTGADADSDAVRSEAIDVVADNMQ